MVTGGASGLGLAVVQRVAAKGGRAVVADLPTSKGEAIAEALGERVVFVATDVSVGIRFNCFNSFKKREFSTTQLFL